ncbi:MAG: MBL fold metallo-hydrolase [Elusimicrobiota bacterium]|nr:MBL fold metallo-hydrolase [Elusimicrobiota bacterium]
MIKRLLFLTVLLFSASTLRAQLTGYIINVGQGDAIYLELPSGGNVLIDGGPSGEPVYEFLKAKGVTKIDHVVLTHPHSDHYRGLKRVFADTDVKNFYDTRAENIDAIGDNNLRELADAEPGCNTWFPEVGEELRWDPQVTVKVLNTCSEVTQSRDNDVINNCSMVIRLYYNGNGMLFMGDAEAAVENAMTRVFRNGLNSSILKVSHHGSRYSSTEKFLARVRPEYAYVSFGVGNVYRHPHIEAMQRVEATGAKLIYTIGGTQSFTIPAQDKGQSFPVRPVFNVASMTAEQKFEEMGLTWDPGAYAGAGPDSPAMMQLSDYVAPEGAAADWPAR